MNINQIIDRLDKVKANGADRWLACCPAHDDKSPSLSIKDTGDRVLLHCFGGCTVQDICAAIGIGIHDLFIDGKAPRQIGPGVSRRQLADTLATECLIVGIAESDRAAGKSISESDLQREMLARQFIRASSEVIHG